MASLNLKRYFLPLAGATTISFFAISDARAYSISITNAGFEDPILEDDDFTDNEIPGWIGTDTSSEGRFGVYNPSTVAFPNEAPEGENIGYLESGSLSQTLSERLKANTTYNLSAQIGSSFYDPIEDFSMQLLAGETILAQAIAPVPADLEFTEVTLSYTALADNPFLDRLLTIRFVENGLINEGSEVSIDDVRLTATPVPEPIATTGLLITAGMMVARKIKGKG
jgi:hypothetical protein